MKALTVDNEFKTLIPPLSAEEFDQLEANCIENGIQDSLKAWNGILIDGHNRYEIAQKHGLEFKIDEMEFASRLDVKYWIIKNQLGRRNLSTYDRSVLALKLKPVIAEKAKEKQATHTEQGYQKSDKAIDTNKELAKVAGVSHDTIHKVETIENSGNEELIEKVKNKDVSINKAYREIKGLPDKPKKVEAKPIVEEEPLPFDEVSTDIVEEAVEDVVEDVSNTFSDSLMDALKSNMSRLTGMDHFYRADVLAEVKKLDIAASEKEEFKKQISECIKYLVHLQNGLIGW